MAGRRDTGVWWGGSHPGVPACQPWPGSHQCASPRMLCCGVPALLLSWTSLAADAAAAVVSGGLGCGGGGACDHDHLSGGPSVCLIQRLQGRASLRPHSLTEHPRISEQRGLRSSTPAPHPSDGHTGTEKGRGLLTIMRHSGAEPR